MPEIVTQRFENILRIQFNRPEKKNAMTFNMYSTVLEIREYASRLQSDDAKEALTVFFEKRQPDFTKFKATA
jgi:1,4-dihydroxy-2-naphthoyl-CoA synthase